MRQRVHESSGITFHGGTCLPTGLCFGYLRPQNSLSNGPKPACGPAWAASMSPCSQWQIAQLRWAPLRDDQGEAILWEGSDGVLMYRLEELHKLPLFLWDGTQLGGGEKGIAQGFHTAPILRSSKFEPGLQGHYRGVLVKIGRWNIFNNFTLIDNLKIFTPVMFRSFFVLLSQPCRYPGTSLISQQNTLSLNHSSCGSSPSVSSPLTIWLLSERVQN